MRASLLNENSKGTASVDLSFKEARKISAPTDSSERSFEHVLTHARKSATPEDSRAKIEKPKSGKAGKAKTSKEAVVTADQRKKSDKLSSKDAKDADLEDAADSSKDNSSPGDDQSAAQQAQNSAKGDEAGDGPGAPSDEANITATAHEAAAGSPSASATKQAETKQRPSAPIQQTPTNAQPQATAANKVTDNAKNSAASANASPGQSSPRPAKSKAADATDNSTKPIVRDGKSADVSIPDKMTATSGVPTAVIQPEQRSGQDKTASTTPVGADSSPDSDSVDSNVDAPALMTTTAPTQAETASVGDDSHSASAAVAIDQSSLSSIAQSFTGGPLASALSTSGANGTSAGRAAASAPSAGTKFVADNHPAIVQSVKTQLLPTGGTMRLRLDPPELGAMQVSVHVKDGVVTASFETSNDQATKMLSHSLGQLKQALESQGITVGKIHVQQSARNESAGERSTDSENDSNQSKDNASSSQQDEQRRETLRRMWERLSIGGDPLDLVA